MFFRRERPKQLSFEDRLSAARAAGFKTESAGSGKTRVERNHVACLIESTGNGEAKLAVKPGVIMGQEIGALTDGGFQKFFLTPSGKRRPALAEDLRAIQDFHEDLREALGMVSLYNESMGTVSNQYLYDRVEGRDQGVHDKPWQ